MEEQSEFWGFRNNDRKNEIREREKEWASDQWGKCWNRNKKRKLTEKNRKIPLQNGNQLFCVIQFWAHCHVSNCVECSCGSTRKNGKAKQKDLSFPVKTLCLFMCCPFGPVFVCVQCAHYVTISTIQLYFFTSIASKESISSTHFSPFTFHSWCQTRVSQNTECSFGAVKCTHTHEVKLFPCFGFAIVKIAILSNSTNSLSL